jgi:hypothetical protein
MCSRDNLRFNFVSNVNHPTVLETVQMRVGVDKREAVTRGKMGAQVLPVKGFKLKIYLSVLGIVTDAL